MLQLLKSHTSVRDYTNEPISDETFYAMMEAAQHAASSNFVQAYSVIHVRNGRKKEQLGKLSKNERQFQSAPLALLFCADLRRLQVAVERTGNEVELGSVEDFIIATIDTAIFAQNFVIAAESKGYGICYIGGVRNNPTEISELFHLPEKVIPLFGMTVGKPAKKNEVKPRLPVSAIIHDDHYDIEKYDTLIQQYDETMNEYYKRRTNNKKDITWTDTVVSLLSKKRREHMKDFIQSKGFLRDDLVK